jgi:hypothetical protein
VSFSNINMFKVSTIVDVVLKVSLFPLEILYFHGPRLWGYGFQEGAKAETICSEVTGIRSGFWSSTPESFTECEDLLKRKFHAFVICLMTITSTLTFLHSVYLMSCKHIILKPLTASVSNELDLFLHKMRAQRNET